MIPIAVWALFGLLALLSAGGASRDMLPLPGTVAGWLVPLAWVL